MDALPAKDKMILAGDLLDTVISRAIFGVNEKAVYDVISKHRLSKKTMQFVDALSYLLSGLSMKKTSVSRLLEGSGFSTCGKRGIIGRSVEMVKLFNNSGYRSQGYPLGGIQSITDGVIASFPKTWSIIQEKKFERLKRTKSVFAFQLRKPITFLAKLSIQAR